MRIGCLQFAPQVGDVENNLSKADAILNEADPEDLDLLVLPELAFSGYNFKSLHHISPFLEEANSGVSSLWARSTALKHDCTVVVGYPEKVDPTLNWPTDPEYYNSAIVINGDGETVANYRKTHLYYTDETWALEGSHGFYKGRLPGLGRTAIGICMDINPYKFEAPWNKFEFAQHALNTGARLVIVSMAWLTNDDPRIFNATPQEPDTNTLMYWASRLEPIIRVESNEEVIVVFANRCGGEDEATYAGTSAVIGIRSGEVWVYGILGRGETELLVVDTDVAPYAKLVYRSEKAEAQVENEDEGFSDIEAGVADKIAPESTHLPRSQEKQSSAPPASSKTQVGNRQLAGSYNHHPGFRMGQGTGRPDSPVIQAPIAPVPAPRSTRPELMIPDDQYMLQRYLESDSPTSYGGTLGNVSIENSLRHLELSNSPRPPEFSNNSENHQVWPPPMQPISALDGTLWETRDDMQNRQRDGFESLALKDDDHHSLRSDVSVWNNQPGRVPEIAPPMTAPPELSHRAAKEASEGRTRRRPSATVSDWNRPPVADRGSSLSKQTSRNQLHKKASLSKERTSDQKMSSGAIRPSDMLRSNTAQGLGVEEVNRGRRRSSQRQSRERRMKSSHSGQTPHPEPVDLSQFTLIEEYHSANCPVHGSPPQSGTRSRNESGARGRRGSRSHSVQDSAKANNEKSKGRRQSSRNTPQIDQNGNSDSQISRPAASSARPVSSLNNKHLRTTKATEAVKDASATQKSSLVTYYQEPKTPKAMLLVKEPEAARGSPDYVISPLKCVEKNSGHVIARPVSSVW
ncbi:Protein N-terminal amidase [Cladobotryum mycophilum]|uniref:Protein N-terminal amidase n=1 Tax=Cladobotryum mycophilum TaxID=491253 RepID=A0ABR0SNJ4_9HYPO